MTTTAKREGILNKAARNIRDELGDDKQTLINKPVDERIVEIIVAIGIALVIAYFIFRFGSPYIGF